MGILEHKTFGMISLGCDKNRVDAERLLGEIRARGYAITDDIAEDARRRQESQACERACAAA